MTAASFVPGRKRLTRGTASDDHAQDTVEYMLVVGAVVVAMVVSFMAFDAVIAGILGLVCPAVDTGNPLAAIGTCITGG